jgi:hypothetical protein
MLGIRVLQAFLAAVLLCGCATRYQDMGLTGGVGAQQITADTFRIISRGNGFTTAETVQDYILLKAAEVTQSAGATHFAIVSAADATRVGSIQTPTTAQTHVIGNTAYTTVSPGSTIPIVKPGQDVYIKVFTLPRGQPAPPGSYAAEEIIRFVGSRVKRA